MSITIQKPKEIQTVLITEIEKNKGKTICLDFRCNEKLGYYDIKNGKRFCRKCRVLHNVLLWKCEGCNNLLSNSQCRETRRLCNSCQGMKPSYE